MTSAWVTAAAIWGAALSTVLAWSRFLPRPKIILAPWPAERPQSSQLEMRVVNSSSWPIEIYRVRRVRLSGKPVEFVANTDPEMPLSNWFDWEELGELYLYVPPHSRGSIFMRGLRQGQPQLADLHVALRPVPAGAQPSLGLCIGSPCGAGQPDQPASYTLGRQRLIGGRVGVEAGSLPSQMKQHRHPSRVFGSALSVVVLIAALLLAAPPASAERDAALAPGAPIAAPEAGATPAAPPPAQATGALAGQQTAVAGRLAARLAGAGESLDVAGQSLPAALLRDSYATAGYGPIWTEDSGIAPAGVVLIDQLQSAKSAGMTMIDPLLAAIADHAGAKTPDELADLDLLLSAALLAATADSGDSPPADLLAGARKGDPRAFVATSSAGHFLLLGAAPGLARLSPICRRPGMADGAFRPEAREGNDRPPRRRAPGTLDGHGGAGCRRSR